MVKKGHKYVTPLQINVPWVMILSQKLGNLFDKGTFIWQWGSFIWQGGTSIWQEGTFVLRTATILLQIIMGTKFWSCVRTLSKSILIARADEPKDRYITNYAFLPLDPQILPPTLNPRVWRFAPLVDPLVSEWHSRDMDSPVFQREVDAVQDWRAQGTTWHVMRDHPLHGRWV